MRRLVRFVGPARPDAETALQPQASGEPASTSASVETDRPLDLGATGSAEQQGPDAGMVDAVARES